MTTPVDPTARKIVGEIYIGQNRVKAHQVDKIDEELTPEAVQHYVAAGALAGDWTGAGQGTHGVQEGPVLPPGRRKENKGQGKTKSATKRKNPKKR